MLTGQSPFDQSASYSAIPLQIEAMAVERSRTWPSVQGGRPDIPWGLESIVRKCLAPDPAQRYQRADHLAEDLRRFLDDRPLKYAPELSRVERVRKFVRRHPRLDVVGDGRAAAAAVLLLAVGTAWCRRPRPPRRVPGPRAVAGPRAGDDSGPLPGQHVVMATSQDTFVRGPRSARRPWASTLSHRGTRWEDHPDLARLGPRRAPQARRGPSRAADAPGRRPSPSRRRATSSGAGRWRCSTRRRRSAACPPPAHSGSNRAEDLERLGDAAQGGGDASARRADPGHHGPRPLRTGDDLCPSRRTSRLRGAHGRARRGAPAQPAALLVGRCSAASATWRLGEHLLAAADFGQCIGLWPEFAWGYFNRGCVLTRGGRKAEAIADYTAALA